MRKAILQGYLDTQAEMHIASAEWPSRQDGFPSTAGYEIIIIIIIKILKY